MSKSTLKEKWGVMQSHLMTGISYMIPVVVGAGMLMGIGGIAGQILNVEIWSPEALNSSDALVSTFAWITQVAGERFNEPYVSNICSFLSLCNW